MHDESVADSVNDLDADIKSAIQAALELNSAGKTGLAMYRLMLPFSNSKTEALLSLAAELSLQIEDSLTALERCQQQVARYEAVLLVDLWPPSRQEE